jgi:tRNA dimethylallyltransferase
VGKTAVAVGLADALRAAGEDPVAVSADALQVYRGLEVLTGAAGPEERARLEHRLVGVVPVTEEFSAGAYATRAHAEIDAALATGRRPIVVGGTGLYLRAALASLSLRPAPPPAVRARWEARMARLGPLALHAELRERAPEAAERVRPTDRSRIVRALELAELDAAGPREGPSELWTRATRRPTALFGLVMERGALYERIDARVDAIVAAGGAEEARRAAAAPASRTARKALGFDELLRGDVEGMKRRTRRYAKRQLTWLRKLPGVELVDLTGREPEDVGREFARRLRGGGASSPGGYAAEAPLRRRPRA